MCSKKNVYYISIDKNVFELRSSIFIPSICLLTCLVFIRCLSLSSNIHLDRCAIIRSIGVACNPSERRVEPMHKLFIIFYPNGALCHSKQIMNNMPFGCMYEINHDGKFDTLINVLITSEHVPTWGAKRGSWLGTCDRLELYAYIQHEAQWSGSFPENSQDLPSSWSRIMRWDPWL